MDRPEQTPMTTGRVWPWRLLGALFRACPALGDLAVSSVVRHFDGADPRTLARSRSPQHVTPAE